LLLKKEVCEVAAESVGPFWPSLKN